ncbi:MAG: hypothetical protein FJ149_05685 [Euryarchaeota archaeon]|nr:hypothetical protein [Euryarchaeota archaeon]
MDLYAEDVLAASSLVLSAALVLLAGMAYARARSVRLLIPLGAGAAVLAVSGLLTVRGAFSTGEPGALDLPLSAALLAVIVILTVVWLAGGRAGRPDRKAKG